MALKVSGRCREGAGLSEGLLPLVICLLLATDEHLHQVLLCACPRTAMTQLSTRAWAPSPHGLCCA